MLLGNNMDASEEQFPDHQPIELVLFCTLAASNSLNSQEYNSAVMFLDPVHGFCSEGEILFPSSRKGEEVRMKLEKGTIFPVLELATATEHGSSHLL